MFLGILLPEGSKRRENAKKVYRKIFKKTTTEEMIYKKWIEQNEPSKEELNNQRNTNFEIKPKISIIVPLYNTPENFLKELIECLKNQTYSNWELCLADGSPTPITYISKYLKDTRIKYSIIGENKGISGNTNEALKLVTGDFIGLLDHDDLLPTFSLFEVVKAINENPNVEFIYTDEDRLESIKEPRYGVFFKPDFSPYTLNSANYICHFSIFKKELMDKLGGFRSEYDGSQDFDIVSRASEITDKIVHIPKVLYHWRVHKNSTAGNSDSKPYAFEVGKKVIKDHVKRMYNTEVEVEDGPTPGSYELIYKVKLNPKVSIIIDLRNTDEESEKRIETEIKKTTYSNYEIIKIKENSEIDSIKNAVENSTGEYFIIFDNKLLEIDKTSYIEELLGICQDENVSIVGTKLYNSDDLIEHAGIIIGMNGVGDYLYKGAPKNAGTYMQRLTIIHNVSCVYYKYSMISKKQFEKLDWIDLDIDENDLLTSIEICLKQLESNKQVVINPTISIKTEKLEKKELSKDKEDAFIKRWDKQYKNGDKYFSPNLSKNDTGLSFNI